VKLNIKWTISMVLLLVVISSAQSSLEKSGATKPVSLFRGTTDLLNPATGKEIPVIYEYTQDPESFQGELTISPKEKGQINVYDFKPEIGQQSLETIYSRPFADLGELICAYWSWGAGMDKLTVYRLSPRGQMEVVFDDVCRFGYEILDVTGDQLPEICSCDGELDSEKKKTKIYKWNGSKFALMKSMDVSVPHFYEIRKDGSFKQ
jgi:hypothetical protein